MSLHGVSHRPFGSGHPYRYDLDQRVPPIPTRGDTYEIRVTTSEAVQSVEIEFDNGTIVLAKRADSQHLVQEFGPFAAGETEAGHLAAAANAALDDAQPWAAQLVAKDAGRYRIRAVGDATTTTSDWFELEVGEWQSAGGVLDVGPSRQRLDTTSVEWFVTASGPHRVRFKLTIDDHQHIIGLGERYASLDHRNHSYDSIVFEQYKHQGQRTYLPIPMAAVVGGEHWGFHIATARRVWFDLGVTDASLLSIEAEVDPEQPALNVQIWNGEPAEIVQHFLAETGQPPLPPEWIFEPWMSGNEWNSQQRVEHEVQTSLDLDIPVGAIVIEAWSDESTFVAFNDAEYEVHEDGRPHRLSDFTFPPDGRWPDPKAMIDRLHDAGVKVLLWQIPLLPTDRGDGGQIAADLATLEQNDWCVHEADGRPYHNRAWWFPGALLPDFTNPAAQQWWKDKRRYLLEDLGVDGFKTDGGEHLWGHDLQFHDGTVGAETNNRFPVLYPQTYHDLMHEAGVDGVTFSRAGHTGSASFPCHWAGDEDSTWATLRASIHAGLSAGVGGIYFWGWDLAGFSGDLPDPELYLRSTALATFCPIMQYHSEFNHHRSPSVDRTPWNIAEQHDAPEVIDVYRRFAHLRRRLVPYLTAQAAQSLESGKPLMRPLCFDFPDDERIWDYPLEFQLGSDLIVAPITDAGQTSVEVYLPAGEWVDLFSAETFTGPIVTSRSVAIDEIAVFRRADAPSPVRAHSPSYLA